jgi:hypothetical protein
VVSVFFGGFPSTAAVLALATLGSSGCASELRLSEVRAADQPNCTIRYSAVRHEVRRFPDYSAIDGSILADDSSVPAADGRGTPRP